MPLHRESHGNPLRLASWIKVNFDVAVRLTGSFVACVGRDRRGAIMFAKTNKHQGDDPMLGEALGALAGMGSNVKLITILLVLSKAEV